MALPSEALVADGLAVNDNVFSEYPIAQWKVGERASVSFPTTSIVESGGKRLPRHERPYRDGWKLDDTGLRGRTWKVTAIFSNRVLEPGMPLNGVAPYPFAVRALLESFEERVTGDLTLPTVGKVRARLETYERTESSETRDFATVELTFIEDNEEALDRATFRPPTVRATIVKLAETTQFSARSAGAWDRDTLTLLEAAGRLEEMMLAPGRAITDVRAQGESMVRMARRISAAQESLATAVGGDFNDPRGSASHRQLRTMEDRVALAESEKASTLPPTKSFTIDVERCSIFDIAARFKQDPEQLLDLNMGRISDPFDLQRDDVIRVFV